MSRSKRILAAFCGGAMLVAWLPALAAGPGYHFYDPSRPITFAGRVTAFTTEPMYTGRTPFVVLTVESAGRSIRVELAPRWFFQMDLAIGMRVRVTGATAVAAAGGEWVIARELLVQGQRFELRDAHGFPLWSQRGAGRGGESRRGGNCRGWGSGV